MDNIIKGDSVWPVDKFFDKLDMQKADRAVIYFIADFISKMIEARKEKKISQSDLAKLTGIDQSSISKIEKLKIIPQIDTMFKLLISLGLTLEIVPSQNENETAEIEPTK